MLGEHGIGEDTAIRRQEFERRMELRLTAEGDEEALAPIRRGGCLGSEEFKGQMLQRMDGHLRGNTTRETCAGRVRQAEPNGSSRRNGNGRAGPSLTWLPNARVLRARWLWRRG